MRALLAAAMIAATTPPAFPADGLALTPPMGWNSWNKFGCDVREALIRGTADALVATGMKDAGYQYLVIDDCSYARMGRELRAAGRPIVFSICEWGSTQPWLWAPGIGHLWRSTGDIQDCWDCGKSWGGMGVAHIIDLQAELYPFAGPGHWNDPDMLEVGNGGLTTAESRAHFSFWALMAAPLMAGNDLRAMSAETREILTNREVIAVDQDPLGMQGRKVRDNGPQEVWMKPLADGSRAVILFNRGTEAGDVAVSWPEIGLAPGRKALVRDLWRKADVGAAVAGRFEAKVGAHDVVMIRVTPAP